MLRAMQAPAITFSDDQAEAWDRVAEQLRGMGVDIVDGLLTEATEGKSTVLGVMGKAGSG